MNQLFDVLAVNIQTGIARIIAVKKSDDNADAIIKMAVMRRGVDEELFTSVPHASHKDGERYEQ